mmetsp:Transcript_25865/g.60027  ORF Transcript_25865/g.60027 Transcript_25865/m.60027 type:complete len:174 (+) Transcript_25865:47-568(+)|eukprot:CAMPEP_0169465890 /NCGR_PEP_ID=MMETSP1042-20121227/21468_1 /TAXON_ID=464988 /ORGANISM="Hemiselmis andersenii, Strain CCMP1180" /LENGTH=173 /DNA_ID=CAMNT_0009578891 /DNA_START=41 /DNA_END=562 /DNA_ORIENTATION=+
MVAAPLLPKRQEAVGEGREQRMWGRKAAVAAVIGTSVLVGVGLVSVESSLSATRPVELWQTPSSLRGFSGYSVKEWRFGRPMQMVMVPAGEDSWQRAMDTQMMRSNLASDDSESQIPPSKCFDHPDRCTGRADFDGMKMVIVSVVAIIGICVAGICSLQSKGHIDLMRENPDD